MSATKGSMLRGRAYGDSIFRILVLAFASFLLLLLVLYFYEVGDRSLQAIGRFGFSYVTGSVWNPPKEIFEVFPEIAGTMVSSAIALLIGVPISLGVSIFLSEMSGPKVRAIIGSVVELLAAVPSVVYGFWGLAFFVPVVMRPVDQVLQSTLGFLPIFQGRITGYDMLSAGVVLAIMIIPIVASISREAMLAVPNSQREAAYALGGTKSEVIRMSVFGYARSGIIAAVFLGFGRALGETMAVTMVIGNSQQIKASLFQPAQTLASLIANSYSEATGAVAISAIIEAGLVLLVISLVVNVGARFILRRVIKRGAMML
jgi:phosphate transport system permease protein